MGLRDGGRLGRHVDSVVLVAADTVLLQRLLQLRQPLGHQVDVLGRGQEQLISDCNCDATHIHTYIHQTDRQTDRQT